MGYRVVGVADRSHRHPFPSPVEAQHITSAVSTLAWEEPLAMLLPKSFNDDGKTLGLSSIEIPFVLPDPELHPELSWQIGTLLTSRQLQRA